MIMMILIINLNLDQNKLAQIKALIYQYLYLDLLFKFIIFFIQELRNPSLKMELQRNKNISHPQLFQPASWETSSFNDRISIFQKQDKNKNDYSYIEEDLLIEPYDKKQFQLLHFPQKSLDISISPFEQSINESFVVSNEQFFKKEVLKKEEKIQKAQEEEDKFTYEYAKKEFGNKNSKFQLNLEEQYRKQRRIEEQRIDKIRKNIQKVYRIDNENKQFYVPCTIEESEDQEEETHETTNPPSYFRQNQFLKVQSKDRQSQQRLQIKKRRAEQLKCEQKKRLIEFCMMSPRIFSY